MELSKCVMNSTPGKGMSHAKVWGQEHKVAGGKTRVLGRDQVMNRECSNPPDRVGPSSRSQWETITLVEKYWWDVHLIKPTLAPGWRLGKTRWETGRPVRRLLQMREKVGWGKDSGVRMKPKGRITWREAFRKQNPQAPMTDWIWGVWQPDLRPERLESGAGVADHEKGMRALLADRSMATRWNS